MYKTKRVIDRGRSETLNEVKPVENKNKNLQSFLDSTNKSHVKRSPCFTQTARSCI